MSCGKFNVYNRLDLSLDAEFSTQLFDRSQAVNRAIYTWRAPICAACAPAFRRTTVWYPRLYYALCGLAVLFGCLNSARYGTGFMKVVVIGGCGVGFALMRILQLASDRAVTVRRSRSILVFSFKQRGTARAFEQLNGGLWLAEEGEPRSVLQGVLDMQRPRQVPKPPRRSNPASVPPPPPRRPGARL